MDNNYDHTLYLPFLKKKKILKKTSKNEKEFLFNIAKNYLYSGFLLNSLEFDEYSLDLKNKLTNLNKNYLFQNTLINKISNSITKELDENNINYVLMKGVALKKGGFYLNNERQFRDLDILIEEKKIEKVYEILKKMGFKYIYKNISDSCKYYKYTNHLPEMQNELKTTVEVHYRVTDPKIYKLCPLTNSFFLNKRKVEKQFIPSINDMVLHAFYHGIVHHDYKHGPIFLLDILRLTEKNYNCFKNIEQRMDYLGLKDELKSVKKISSLVFSKQDNENKILLELESFFKFSYWNKRTNKHSLNDKFFKLKKIKSNIANSLEHTRYKHQTGYITFKFIYFYFIKIIDNLYRFRM